MGLAVADDVLARTTKCQNEFACLEGGCCTSCKILSLNGPDVLFIESAGDEFCAYQLNYGYSTICTCPTRYEICKQYGQ